MPNNECIFCKLAQGEGEAHIVYEDGDVFAFMDKHPIRPGHVLVIPRKHEPEFWKLSQDIYIKIMLIVQRISGTVDEVYAPKKVGLAIAGFDVSHAHIHVVPMHEYHDLTSQQLFTGNIANPSADELAAEAVKIRTLLS